MRRWIPRVLVFAVVAVALHRFWTQYELDRRFARARPELRKCLAALPDDLAGYAVNPSGDQAASWGARKLILCDYDVETWEGNWLVHPSAAVLHRPGILSAAFRADGVLELRFRSGAPEGLTFGPPTGMDGHLYVWNEDPTKPNWR